METLTNQVLKVFLPALIAFLIGLVATPSFSKFFYKYKLWKKVSRTDSVSNPSINSEYKKVHNSEIELSTPRVGGIIIWVTVLLTIIVTFALFYVFKTPFLRELDFVSKNQTLLIIIALVLGGVLGLVEDLLEVFPPDATKSIAHGLTRWTRVYSIGGLSLAFALWFYFKLGESTVYLPFWGDLNLGWLFIPFFILVVLGTFSSRVIDGIDGLSAGVLLPVFSAYGIIAFLQNQIDIATLCSVIVAGLLVFLWFNIPPARFWMGETGMLSLTLALSITAFLTDQVLLLLIIGLPLVATSLSSLLQIVARRFFNKKVFKLAPLHHHFQALGWPSHKVTMRYWVVSAICSLVGVIVFIIG